MLYYLINLLYQWLDIGWEHFVCLGVYGYVDVVVVVTVGGNGLVGVRGNVLMGCLWCSHWRWDAFHIFRRWGLGPLDPEMYLCCYTNTGTKYPSILTIEMQGYENQKIKKIRRICWNNIKLIIMHHDFLPPPRMGSHVKSDNKHTHSHQDTPWDIYLTHEPWFSVVAPSLRFIPTASCHGIPPLSMWLPPEHGMRSERTQCQAKMDQWNSFSYICTRSLHSFRSFAHCRAASTVIPPPLTSAINTLLAIRYSSILSTCPNHLNTLWSALLATTPVLFQLSYAPLHS